MTAPILFDALIEPNPPLSSRRMFFIVGGIAVISFIAGVVSVSYGAWPVTPFFGADVLLVYWAFVLVKERARHRERITLTPERLTVERTAPGLCAVTRDINPYWLRVEHDDPERVGAELVLVNRNERVVVGRFLGADERARLADALRAALAEARRTPSPYPA